MASAAETGGCKRDLEWARGGGLIGRREPDGEAGSRSFRNLGRESRPCWVVAARSAGTARCLETSTRTDRPSARVQVARHGLGSGGRRAPQNRAVALARLLKLGAAESQQAAGAQHDPLFEALQGGIHRRTHRGALPLSGACPSLIVPEGRKGRGRLGWLAAVSDPARPTFTNSRDCRISQSALPHKPNSVPRQPFASFHPRSRRLVGEGEGVDCSRVGDEMRLFILFDGSPAMR